MVYGVADTATAQITGSVTRQRTLDVLLQQTPPLPAGVWPNEPVGFTVLNDWDMSQTVPQGPADQLITGSPGPWHVVYNSAPPNTNSKLTLIADVGAPLSPPGVYQMLYAAGSQAGSAPATLYHPYNGGGTRFYHGFWWKCSAVWTDGPGNTNKMYYPDFGTGSFFMNFAPGGGIHELQPTLYPGSRNMPPNVAHVNVTKGAWHQIEMYNDISANIFRWWLDGVLVGNYSDAIYAGPITNFKFSPTWGGVGATIPQDQFFYYDHYHISVQ